MIDSFFDKMQAMPPAQIDEKYVVFVREFTKIALGKRFQLAQIDFSKENQHDNDIPFFLGIRDKERANIAAISPNLSELVPALEAETHDYGLRLFWQICQDSESGQASQLSTDDQELVIQSLLEIFADTANVRQVRSLYLIKAMENILANRSLHQSITVAEEIIQSLQNDPAYRQLDESEEKEVSLVLELQNKVQIIDALVQSLTNYHHVVKNKVKQMYQQGAALPNKLDEQAFQGRYSHQQTLQKILDFVNFFVVQGQKDNSSNHAITVSLGVQNIKQLWTLFVKDPNF